MIKYLFIVINSLSLFIFSLFSDDTAVTVTSNLPSSITAGQEVVVDLKVTKGTMTGAATLQLELPEGIVVKESENHGAAYTDENGIVKWSWAELPAAGELSVRLLLIASESAVGLKTISAKYLYAEDNIKKIVEMKPAEVTVISAGNAATATKGADSSASKTAGIPILSTNSEPSVNVSAERTITKVNDIEYLVTIKIKKGITTDFAKYSDDIIERVKAKEVKTDGSSFSVSVPDKKIIFRWTNVPSKDELDISYTLTGNFEVPVTLNGEYYYLENHQTKTYKLSPQTINPSSAPVAAQKEEKPATPVKEAEITKEPEPKKAEPTEQLTTDVPKTPRSTTQVPDGKMSFAVQIGAFANAKTDAATLKQKFNISETIQSDMQGGLSKFMIGSHAEYKDARYHKDVVKDVNGIKTAFVVAYNGPKRITVQEALMIINQKWFK